MSDIKLLNEWTFWAANGDEKLSKICDVNADSQQEADTKFHAETNNKYNDGGSWICSFQKFEEID